MNGNVDPSPLLFQTRNFDAPTLEATRGFTSEAEEPRFVGHVTFARTSAIKRSQAAVLEPFMQSASARTWETWTANAIRVRGWRIQRNDFQSLTD